ncbi:MAG: glycosyltransferase [Deltaproteobacteria bacterium]|nr:glycosyltransferase [Deltaproteobacteria bacterium]
MKASVITVIFNEVNHIESIIKSVLSQDCADFELLLIDGGSTDGTVEIIKKYAKEDSRLKWISEPDNGAADAISKGLKLASGNIIGFINAGDELCDSAIKSAVITFMENPTYDIFHGDLLKLQGEKVMYLLKPSRNIDFHIWHEMPINSVGTFYTRRAIDMVGGYDFSYKVATDYDMLLRMYIKKCRFYYLDMPLAKMRYGGVSDTNYVEGLKEIFISSTKNGYPKYKAALWFAFKFFVRTTKNFLRKIGFHSVIRLHPKFHPIGGGKSKMGR